MSKKILLVDDDVDILAAVSFLLEVKGYTVETTPCGEEVDETIKTFEPDLLLLDCYLLDGDGPTICRRLKRQHTTKHIPVVLISAEPQVKQASLDAGANAFLTKPFDTESLMATIRCVACHGSG